MHGLPPSVLEINWPEFSLSTGPVTCRKCSNSTRTKPEFSAHTTRACAGRNRNFPPVYFHLASPPQKTCSLMDSECPAANMQPSVQDGTTPSGISQATRSRRASESAESCERRLQRERARWRQRLASETAEERERRLSQRRVRDRARRAARSSPAGETHLQQWRSAERQR